MLAVDLLGERSQQLPLIPLRSVLFPGGLLHLTVLDERYLALLRRCQAKSRPFGALCVREGEALESVGVLASVEAIDDAAHGCRARCRGDQRFRVLRERPAGDDGLRRARIELIAGDATLAPVPAMFPAVQALGRALATMRAARKLPAFGGEEHFGRAGWVANRWCELLPIALPAKQRLMELTDPGARLALVDRYLREQRVIG